MSFFRSGGYSRFPRKPILPPDASTGAFSNDDRQAAKLAGLGVNATKLEAQVFAIIQRRGALGTIGTDVRNATGLEMQTITPRWAKLCEKGFIKGQRDSEGNELMRIGHCGAPQTVWFPREPGDPIYVKTKQPFDHVKRLLPKLSDDELEMVRDIISKMLGDLD